MAVQRHPPTTRPEILRSSQKDQPDPPECLWSAEERLPQTRGNNSTKMFSLVKSYVNIVTLSILVLVIATTLDASTLEKIIYFSIQRHPNSFISKYRQTSLYAIFLSANSRICDPEMLSKIHYI